MERMEYVIIVLLFLNVFLLMINFCDNRKILHRLKERTGGEPGQNQQPDGVDKGDAGVLEESALGMSDESNRVLESQTVMPEEVPHMEQNLQKQEKEALLNEVLSEIFS